MSPKLSVPSVPAANRDYVDDPRSGQTNLPLNPNVQGPGDPRLNLLGEPLYGPGQTDPTTVRPYSGDADDLQVNADSRYDRITDPNAYPGEDANQRHFGPYSGQFGDPLTSGQVRDPRLNPLDPAFTEADKRILAFLPNYDQAVKLEMIARRKANWLQTVVPLAVNLVEAAFYGKPDMGPQKRAIVEKLVADLSADPSTPVELVNETHVLNSIEANLANLKNDGSLIRGFNPDDPAFPYAPRTDAGMYAGYPIPSGNTPVSTLGTDPSHPYQQTRSGMQQNLDNPISAKRSDLPDPIAYNAPVSYPNQVPAPAKRTEPDRPIPDTPATR